MERKYSRKYIGEVYKTTEGFTVNVVDGGSAREYCTIEIEGRQWEVRTGALKKGNVKNPWHPSVYGTGYLGTTEKNMKVRNLQAYNRWKNMLQRCYCAKYQAMNPSYVGCTVVEEWHSFYNFLQWYKDNVRLDANRIKYQLDKDLLSGSSKYYGPDTCVFIPAQVNTFLTNGQLNNTSGHVGVTYQTVNGKYQARIRLFNPFKENRECENLGYYETAKQASFVYKLARIQEVKIVKKWMLNLGYSSDICDKVK